jgi:hypothetical protein
MPNEITATIARRYQFESWRGTSLLAQRLFLLNYTVRGNEIPRWNLGKVKPMRAVPSVGSGDQSGPIFLLGNVLRGDLTVMRAESASMLTLPLSPHATAAGVPFDLPPAHTRAFWRSADTPDALIEVELHECSSITAAHEWLLHLIAVFESPLLTRQEEPAMGDVCFSAPDPTMFLFARGNMVLHVRNAGRVIVEVTEVARSLDANLIAKPKTAQRSRRRSRAGESAEVHKFRLGTRVLLDFGRGGFRISPGASRPATTTWKIFYSDGEVGANVDGLYFVSQQVGPHSLEVYTMEQAGPAEYRELRLESER